MGNYFGCLSTEISAQRQETYSSTNIEDMFIIQPSLLPSVFGIKRRGQRRSNPLEIVTITSLYKKASEQLALMHNEISLLKSLSHPNIIVLEAAFEDDLVFHEVTEEVLGTTLTDYLLEKRRLNELQARKILKQVLKALLYMHQKQICYGNLTLDSIVIINEHIKLVDFTKARREEDQCGAVAGNYNFLPPEAFVESYGCMSDMWSVGVIAYYLLQGFLPFDGQEKVEIIANIQKVRYSVKGLSENAKKFIGNLLVLQPQGRLKADQALADNWMRDILEVS